MAIDEGTIVELGTGPPPPDATDLGDAVLAPGFVDLQVNGIGDVDFSHTDVAGIERATQRLLSHGVTTFCPTLISGPLDEMASALGALAAADVAGVHLEGPFLGGAPGAHRREYLLEADVSWMRELLSRHPDVVRIVTLAPEADRGLALTRVLVDSGVLVSLGHSTCSLSDAVAAADAGARAVTHLFNGMAPLHHRDPGLVGAALDDDRLTPWLIADLVHVHPVALRIAAASKHRIGLVSDAIGIDAEWARSRGVREVDGAPRLADGTLAGSVLTMDKAVANMVSIGVGLERAVEMASTIPAHLIGLEDRGVIRAGARADLVALDDNDLSVVAVWSCGERAL